MACLVILLYGIFFAGIARITITGITAISLLGSLGEYIDRDHPDRSWLRDLVYSHLIGSWLLVPWFLVARRGLEQQIAIEIFGFGLCMIPLLLLFPWFGTAGSSRASRQLIRGLRILGTGYIVLAGLALLSFDYVLFVVVAAIGWLYLDVYWVQRLLDGLKQETERVKTKARRRQPVAPMSELIGE